MPADIDAPKKFLTDLFETAVSAADPMKTVPAHLPPAPNGRLIVIGAGKASARMGEAVESYYGPCEGLIITRYGYSRPCKGIEIVEAAHPVPDKAGELATLRLLDLVSDLEADDLVIALISGGGSALLCAPATGLTLGDKMAVNAALLASGAPIGEMNVVRKRLSKVKGGRLAAACYPARVLSLLISDVPGDDPGLIASGPTVGDTSSSTKAGEILDRRNITLAPHITKVIAGSEPAISPGDPRLENARSVIVAAPSQSLEAATKHAEKAGCDVRCLGHDLEGEARELARDQAILALTCQANMKPGDPPVLLLSGGECTVTRIGDGIGGPNAEFVLAFALALGGASNIHILACDTDGVDGAAEVAGAYAGPDTLVRSARIGLNGAQSLISNDAHKFFERLDDQIVTGPTLTNVNDFRAVLVLP